MDVSLDAENVWIDFTDAVGGIAVSWKIESARVWVGSKAGVRIGGTSKDEDGALVRSELGFGVKAGCTGGIATQVPG